MPGEGELFKKKTRQVAGFNNYSEII